MFLSIHEENKIVPDKRELKIRLECQKLNILPARRLVKSSLRVRGR